MKGVNHYQAILFDAGGTLITHIPLDDEVLLHRWQRIGLTARPPEIHRAVKQSELWIGDQIMRVMISMTRMPDSEFAR
jgi:hypothetical protein